MEKIPTPPEEQLHSQTPTPPLQKEHLSGKEYEQSQLLQLVQSNLELQNTRLNQIFSSMNPVLKDILSTNSYLKDLGDTQRQMLVDHDKIIVKMEVALRVLVTVVAELTALAENGVAPGNS